ncbi:hypothetical protein LVD17_16800 [Fulvivirga ulvae]|uniref:hypothetical protein n=1 Tax=Fulvivirga ulvae TaxID=2904245 RepID=UPI001F2A4889|nr:hypothetical protein [Fulvivirga ulvae]UII29958.1 hypothetical protein LVD17_16800 [Fulvivirga ulvae]
MLAKNNFRSIISVCLLLVVPASVYAQKDSVSVTSEIVDIENPDTYCYFSTADYEQKTIFKLSSDNFGYTGDFQRIPGFHVSFERKLSATFSAELGMITPVDHEYTVFANLRYYYNKGRKRRQHSKDGIDNFNGSYFLLGVYRTMHFNNYSESYYSNILRPEDQNLYTLLYGKQQKVGKWGFIDVAGGLSYIPQPSMLRFGMNFKVGLGYGKLSRANNDLQSSKFEASNDDYADKKGLLKIANPIMFMSISDGWYAGSMVAYERNLTSNISIVPMLRFSVSDMNQEFNLLDGKVMKHEFKGIRIGFDLQARYFYNRNKRMRSGCLIKNFTGNYFFIEGEELLLYYDIESYFNDGIEARSSHEKGVESTLSSLLIGWGTQQRLGKRGFLDLGVGWRYINQEYPVNLGVNAQVGLLLGK